MYRDDERKPREIWGTVNKPINAFLSLFYLKECQGHGEKMMNVTSSSDITAWSHPFTTEKITDTTVTSQLTAAQ